jgi:hypothetical protein
MMMLVAQRNPSGAEQSLFPDDGDVGDHGDSGDFF